MKGQLAWRTSTRAVFELKTLDQPQVSRNALFCHENQHLCIFLDEMNSVLYKFYEDSFKSSSFQVSVQYEHEYSEDIGMRRRRTKLNTSTV